MRRHLYRGKRVDNGEWIEGDLTTKTINFTDGKTQESYYISRTEYGMSSDTYDCEYMSGFEEEVIPETVCEWTGKLDKNGKKIFEGDIVQGEAEEARGVVEWQHSECRYLISIRNGYDWLFMDDDEWRVIGNIHDNPELLEEK